MNVSVVQINNAALGLVGCGAITALTDGSREAQACQLFWPLTLEYILGVHPWKCVGVQATLTTTTTAPQFGYTYAYPVPANFARMISMDDGDDAFHVAGRVLQCDDSPAYIWYVPNDPDLTRMDASLVESLTFHQAYKLALALRQDAALADTLLKHYEQFFLPVIRHADASRRGVRTMSAGTITEMFRQ